MQVEVTPDTFNIIAQLLNSDTPIPAKAAGLMANAQKEWADNAQRINGENNAPLQSEQG